MAVAVEQGIICENQQYNEGITVEIEELTQEACGIVAFYNFEKATTPQQQSDQFQTVLTAGEKLQHRGPHGAGRVIQTELGIQRKIGAGKVSDVFSDEDVLEVAGYQGTTWTVLQTRYGTNGHYGEDNLQPCKAITPEGDVVTVVHNGEFVGTQKMREKLAPAVFDDGLSDSYLFTQLLAQTPGETSDEKVLNALAQVDGAASLAIGIGDVLYLTKGHLNVRPLFTGKVGDNLIAASETVALDAVGATHLQEVRRGEVLRVDKSGVTVVIKQGEEGEGHVCDLEFAYFSKRDSLMPTYQEPDDYEHPERWRPMSAVRIKCGEIIAEESPIDDIDFVVGVPGTGIDVGKGYADALRATYLQEAIQQTKASVNANERAFLSDDDMNSIKAKVLRKLIINSDENFWKDKKVVIGDDSIIRGNVSSVLVDVLYGLGVKELHFLSGFPRVQNTCHLGVSIRDKKELIARDNADEATIAQRIIDLANENREKKIPKDFPLFVHFISPEGFMRARSATGKIIIPDNPDHIALENGGCLGCALHKPPIDKEGVIYDYKSHDVSAAA